MNVGHASACRRAEARHLGATEERVSFARIGRLNACASRLAFRVAGNPACRRPFRRPSRYATNFSGFAARCLQDTKSEKIRTNSVQIRRRTERPPAGTIAGHDCLPHEVKMVSSHPESVDLNMWQ